MAGKHLPDRPLSELATRINAEHAEAEAALRTGLEHARNAGGLLLEAKGRLGHGEWIPWLKANVDFSTRTAQAYMRVAGRWEELEAKAQHVALLTYRDALRLLAEEPNQVTAEAVRVAGRVYPTPFARYLPDIDGEAWEGFLESIRTSGILVPVILDEEGSVIDGRQRLRAAADLGLADIPTQVRPGLDGYDKLQLFNSLNFIRAHYTKEQLATFHAGR